MIISLRSKSLEELEEILSKDDRIVIWSCDMCIKYCGLGGWKRMKQLEEILEADEYDVIEKMSVSMSCELDIVRNKESNKETEEILEKASAIIVLACEDGYDCVKKIFENKKVIEVTETVGIGNFSVDRGPLLTDPLEDTGIEPSVEGYPLKEVADELGLYHTFFNVEREVEQEKVDLIINGERCKAEKGSNLLEACEANGFEIPHLCYEPGLTPSAACRLCLVKVKDRDELVPSCATKVEDGMEVITEDEELENLRRTILEMLLSEHEHNCLFCVEEEGVLESCELLKLARQYGIEDVRFPINEETQPVDDSSPVIMKDPNKCILCGRCVRACEEVSGMKVLSFADRGEETTINAGLNEPLDQTDCATCMACVLACPTGALTDKLLHFEGENWEAHKIHPP